MCVCVCIQQPLWCQPTDSWVDVPEGKGKSREEGTVEESLTHSRSQQEMEQLLASAASDDEAEESPA